MTDAGKKPVLWVSLTSPGRGYATEDSLKELQERLAEHLGEDYEIVVADDRVRLLDAEEVQALIQDLQQEAEKMGHENDLFSAATEDDTEDSV